MTDKVYDVVVVGSGAAGGFAAKALAERGLSVLVLEAGRQLLPDEMLPKGRAIERSMSILPRIRTALTGQPLQARVAFFNERIRHLFVNDWKHRYTTPKDRPFLWIRGRHTGGRIQTFGRVLFRWSDHDFKGASRGMGGVDWPISYADLAPWYEKVEIFLGVYGNRDDVQTAPDGAMAAQTPLSAQEERFRSRVEMRWPDRHVVAWRFNPYTASPLPAALKAAMESGRVTLRANAIADYIETDPVTGRATGLTFVDRKTRERHRVRARAVVLGASPVESVRLLLNSRAARHPGGIGNSSGLLGRYFMDQCASLMFGRWPETARDGGDAVLPQHPFFGATGGMYIPRYVNTDEQPALPFKRGYSYQGSLGRYGKPDQDGFLPFAMMCFGEMLPYADNRITLDPSRKDRWGIPLPHISCGVHENERIMLERQIRDSVEMIEASGGTADFWASPLGLGEKGGGVYPERSWPVRWFMRRMLPKSMVLGAAIHESGGARMGDDPQQSCLNAFGQVWDAPNVVVTDASAFPSGGTLGTTLTVMALSLRACTHLADELLTGTIDDPKG